MRPPIAVAEAIQRTTNLRNGRGTMNKDSDLGVLIIYTGGTIGSVPEDRHDPTAPLVPAKIDEVIEWLPRFEKQDRKIPFGNKLVRLGTHSWEEPLDSSNITSRDWLQIADVIASKYAEYDGFVVLHGTDTMAYTASALAFIFENLRKPVVVTGSQLPIGETRSDAVQNLVTAIEIAAARCLDAQEIAEVSVFFRDHLLRGCRTTKHSASDFGGFSSPNLHPLARAGEHIVVTPQPLPVSTPQHLRVAKKIEDGIVSLTVYPGMSPGLLESILMADGLRGVVLQTFGAGNAPSTPGFLGAIKRAVTEGQRIIVDVTQCLSGEAELGRYEVSSGLLAMGVISGMDMTGEAALTKLAVILGEEADPDVAADFMQINLRGEQRQSVFNLHYSAGSVDEDPFSVSAHRPMVAGDRFDPESLDRGVLRLLGVTMEARRGKIALDAYIDLPTDPSGDPIVPETPGGTHYLGTSNRQWNQGGGEEYIFIDCTETLRIFVDGQRKPTITLVNKSPGAVAWSDLAIALWTVS